VVLLIYIPIFSFPPPLSFFLPTIALGGLGIGKAGQTDHGGKQYIKINCYQGKRSERERRSECVAKDTHTHTERERERESRWEETKGS
jgi:hypothetical protein